MYKWSLTKKGRRALGRRKEGKKEKMM